MSEEDNYEQLAKQLQRELDLKNQALYDCERQKKTAEVLMLECQEEIRVLQTGENEENRKLEAKIQQLEETIVNLKVTYNERISCLEKEITIKNEEITDLKRELDYIIKLSDKQKPAEDDKLLEENGSLKEQYEELLNEVDCLTKICENKENEITTLHEINTQLKEELENYKEILNCKKDELNEANVINQDLQDKYSCLKAEFEALKNKPLNDQSRGNSLFAEVDDRRVQLQQRVNTMKTHNLDLKREKANHLRQIAVLRNENANLLARWESEVKDREDDADMILLSYKNQIKMLTELVESYKKELKEQDGNKNDGSVRFFDKMLRSKNEEIEALKEKLSRNSLNETILSHDLATARREIRTYKLEILKLQNDIGQLENDIEELKLSKLPNIQETPVIEKEQLKLKSIVKKENIDEEVKIIDLVDETEKENAEDKKVQFTENTLDPKVTDRSKYRRGGRILESKPVYVSTVPKRKI